MKKIYSILKRTILFFFNNPAYLGFCGAIIGAFLGGLISLYSLKFSKEMEFAASRKKHIEQIYLNLEFSFSLFKDGILSYYCSDLAAFHCERILNISLMKKRIL
jgi:ABC-type lipoprotein release transport system permease subunit